MMTMLSVTMEHILTYQLPLVKTVQWVLFKTLKQTWRTYVSHAQMASTQKLKSAMGVR